MSRNTQKPNDVVTLADLAPRRPVVGGSDRRIFGSSDPQERMMAPKKAAKDLSAKTPVKGGRLSANDNTTLVRAAKPGKKDLPAKKTIKAGRLSANDNITLVRVARCAGER